MIPLPITTRPRLRPPGAGRPAGAVRPPSRAPPRPAPRPALPVHPTPGPPVEGMRPPASGRRPLLRAPPGRLRDPVAGPGQDHPRPRSSPEPRPLPEQELPARPPSHRDGPALPAPGEAPQPRARGSLPPVATSPAQPHGHARPAVEDARECLRSVPCLRRRQPPGSSRRPFSRPDQRLEALWRGPSPARSQIATPAGTALAAGATRLLVPDHHLSPTRGQRPKPRSNFRSRELPARPPRQRDGA